MVLLAVLGDGGLGELAIIGSLILISGLTRLATLLQGAGSLCEVCFMVFFYFANFMSIVDFHPLWLCSDLRRRIISGLLKLCRVFHPRWRCMDLLCYWHFRGTLEEFGHFGVGVL